MVQAVRKQKANEGGSRGISNVEVMASITSADSFLAEPSAISAAERNPIASNPIKTLRL